MAVNPMQKKARNSFLLGMLVTFIICAIIGIMVYILIVLPENKEKSERGQVKTVYVLNRDVKSGEEITASMFKQIDSYENLVPANSVNAATIANITSGKKVVARIDMYKNTVVTQNAVALEEEQLTDDVRTMEYNMLMLPINVTIGDYVDVRITFPNGQDFIVIAKKEIKNIQGNTVTFEMSEAEILMLNSAVVESYIMKASNIYVAKYVEPGMQEKASNTYTPTSEVIRLINADSNIVTEAKQGLADKFNEGTRSDMNSSSGQYSDEARANIEEGIQQQIENAKKAREEYLTGISAE